MKRLANLLVLLLFVAVSGIRAQSVTGTGLSFDGVNDYVSLNNTLGNFGTGDFSIEMQVKTGATNLQYLLSKRNNCGSDNFISMQLAGGKFSVEVAGNGGADYTGLLGTSVVNDNNWHQVAATRINGLLSLYVDGVFQVSGYSIANINNNYILTLGSSVCNGQNGSLPFNGSMDEVRFWSRGLCVDEILNNKNCELNATGQTGLLALYHFNQGIANGDNTGASVPGAPIVSTVIAGNSQATVSFNPPASDGGMAISSYTVTSSPGGITASGTSSPVIVSGLTNGQSYTFTVIATNGMGNSASSVASLAVVPVGAPGPPTGLSAVAGNAQATVSFTAPVTNGGSAITSYTITSSPGGFTASGSSSPITITGLTNGAAYTFTVKATNANGTGPNSASSNPVIPAGVPGAPSITSVSADNEVVMVSINAPTSDGGSAITSYTVTSSPGGFTASGTSSPIFINGLTNGQAYTFTAKAGNVNGYGALSAPSSSVTPATVPSVGAIVSVTGGDQSATVSFSTPFNGGSPILNYVVTASPGGVSLTANTSPFVFTGLTNGNYYTFTVRAVNALGSGPTSPASNPPTLVQAAVVDNALWRIAIPNDQVLADIDPLTGLGVRADGSEYDPLTLENVLPAPSPAIPVYRFPEIILVTLNPVTLELTTLRNTIIYPEVREERDFGFGLVFKLPADYPIYYVTTTGALVDVFNDQVQVSPEFNIIAVGEEYTIAPTPLKFRSNYIAPPVIRNVTAGNGQAAVSFYGTFNGAGAINSYTVTSSPGGITASGSSSPILISGLTNGQAYTFTVSATDYGNSVLSAPSSPAVIPVGPPLAPANASATAGNGQATVSFNQPVSNGGSAITSYTVTSSPGGFTASGSSSPIVITGLTNGTSYTFTVKATNAIGTSPNSASSNPVTPAGVPGAPSITSATRGTAQVTVGFSPPSSNGGSAIQDYTVTSSPGGFTKTGAASPLTVTGLTNGQSYTFTVRARNVNGYGALSAPSSSVTPATVPSVGAIVSVTGGDQSATVSFSTPFNGGSPILNYVVTASPGGVSLNANTSPFVFTGLTNGNYYTFTVRAVNALGSGPTSAASSPPTLVSAPIVDNAPWRIAISNGDLLCDLDPMTGNCVRANGATYDPFTREDVLPVPSPPIPVYLFPPGYYIVTLNPQTNELTTLKYTVINLDARVEVDFFGNIISYLPGDAQVYYVTTTGTFVDAANDQVQFNPGTLDILASGEPYTIQPTPLKFRSNYIQGAAAAALRKANKAVTQTDSAMIRLLTFTGGQTSLFAFTEKPNYVVGPYDYGNSTAGDHIELSGNIITSYDNYVAEPVRTSAAITADNISVTTLLIDAAGNNNGTLNNFALTGNTSNWTTGIASGNCVVFVTPAAPITGVNRVCTGSTTTLSNAITGGIWSSNNSPVATVSASGVVSGVMAGTAIITYLNKCGGISNMTVTVNPLPLGKTSQVGSNTFCAGGSTILTATEAGAYLWSNNATTQSITVTASGNYSVTVTDANNCSITSGAYTIVVSPVPTATVTADGPTTFCSGRQVVLTASAGSSYLWSNNATTQSITVNATGNYNVRVTNANNCSATSATMAITVNEIVTPTFTQVAAICNGATVSALPTTSTNGITGTWLPAINNTATTTYTFTPAIGQCAATTTMTIPVKAVPLTPTISVVDNCNGTSTLSTVAPGTLLWSSGETTSTITVYSAGTYTVTQTVNGCASAAGSGIAAPKTTPDAILIEDTNCEVITLLASNAAFHLGATLLWSTGSTYSLETVYSAGTYSVTQTINGCTSVPSQVTVSAPRPRPAAPTVTLIDHCNGTTTLTASNYQYALYWYFVPFAGPTGVNAINFADFGESYTVNEPGLYAIRQNDTASKYCPSLFLEIPVTLNRVVPAITGPSLVCMPAFTQLNNAMPGGVWSSSDPSVATVDNTGKVTGNTSGICLISYTVAGTCIPTVTHSLTVYSLAAEVIAIGSTDICAGSSVLLSSVFYDDYAYQWSNGETTPNLNVTASGVYTVKITDANGCVATSAPVTVTVKPLPASLVSANGPTTFCAPGSVVLTSAYPTGNVWNTGETTQSITVSATANYSVRVTQNGCTAVSSAVPVTAAPSIFTVISNNAGSGTWTAGQNMNEIRIAHTATLLQNGKVLIAGGSSGNGITASSALYDPATGVWTPTGSMLNARQNASAVLLPNGKVFVTGGYGDNGPLSSELFDPVTGTWSLCAPMNVARFYHTPTLLANGKVLVYGGVNNNIGLLRSAEIYNPSTNSWTAAGDMGEGKYDATGVLLPNGKVLVSGGQRGMSLFSSQLYDPSANTWTNTGDMQVRRAFHGMSVLPNGKVLASGGLRDDGYAYEATNTAELYDPATGIWTLTGSMTEGRYWNQPAIIAPDGKVIVIGGVNNTVGAVASVEIYDPVSGTWSTTGSLNSGRCSQTNTLLSTGKILVTGGATNSGSTNSTELYGVSFETITHLSTTITGDSVICATKTTQLTGPIAGGRWSSGNEATATVNATGLVTGIAGGTVTINYTLVSAGGCATTVGKTVIVNPKPTATITADGPTTFCSGRQVVLTASAGSSYLWSNNATTQSITVNASGNYSVTVTNANTCSATSAATAVTVNALPTATITAGGATTFCAGGQVILTASAGSSYLWSNNATTQSITVNATGNYSVTVTNANNCSATSAATGVTVSALPTPTVTASGPTIICAPNTVTLTSPSTTGNLWSNGETTQAITISAVDYADNYSVTVTQDGCSATSEPVYVEINASPVLAELISRASNVCVNATNNATRFYAGPDYQGVFTSSDPLVLSASLLNPYNSGQGGDVAHSGPQNPYIVQLTGVSPGTAVITHTFTNGSGCVSSESFTVTVSASPVATITASGTTALCPGGSVTLHAGEGSSYYWSNDQTTRDITVSVPGNYTVEVSNEGCSIVSAPVTVTMAVINMPVITGEICAGNTLTANLQGSELTKLVWNLNGAPIFTVLPTPAPGTAQLVIGGTDHYGSGPGQLSTPTKMQVDAAGNIYFIDVDNHRVQKYAPGATTGVTVAGGNGAGSDANQLNYPNGLFVDASGNVYVADQQNHRVQKWTPGATEGVTVAGGNGEGSEANQLLYPSDVTVDAAGNMYVADANNRVQKWAPGATTGETIIADNNEILAIARDGAGNIYTLGSNKLKKWGADGSLVAVLAGDLMVPVGIGRGASGLAVDASGNIYITSNEDNTVQKWVSVEEGFTIIANGYEDGLNWPTDVAVDGAGTVYIVDSRNNRILKVVTGIVADPVLYENAAPGTYMVTAYAGDCTTVSEPFVVNPKPEITPITGVNNVCTGTTTTLSNSTAGGEWKSDDESIAIVDSDGNVTGLNPGTTNIIYTVTNDGGCSATVSISFTVNGVPDAVIIADGSTTICPSGSVVLHTDAVDGSTYQWQLNGIAITDATSAIYAATASGSYTVIITNSSGCASASSNAIVITVQDITAPVPVVTTLPVITAECSVTIDARQTSSSGATPPPSSGATPPPSSGATPPPSSGATPPPSSGATPPPSSGATPTPANQSGTVVSVPVAMDDCAGTVTGTTSDPLTYSQPGTYTIHWIYDDGNGNTSTQEQTVIIHDVTAPVPDTDTLVTLTFECASTEPDAPTATDNCAGTITGTTSDPLTYTTQGTHIIHWIFDDRHGNTTEQDQTIIIQDVTAPVADAEILSIITAECSVHVTAPTATDNCAGPITGTTPDAVDYTAQGTYTITWTFDDKNGNTSIQTQTVIVKDVTAPVPVIATLPVVNGECSASVTAPRAIDNCSGIIVGTTTDSLSYNKQGSYTITWMYDDGNHNITTQTQTVIVRDVTAPVPVVATLPIVNGECFATVTAPRAIDNCSGIIVGTTTDSLSYNKQGSYTITWMYDDGNHNVTTQTQTVIVRDVTAPVPAVAILPTITGECSATVKVPSAIDNCSGIIIGTTSDSLFYSTQGSRTITWRYDDHNGNISTQTQTVIVRDMTAPLADVKILPTVTGECMGRVTAPTATDNCAGSVTATTNEPLEYSAQGTYVITWTYDDHNGNTSTQTQTVIIRDVTAPSFVFCQGNINGVIASGISGATVSYAIPVATDNCSAVTVRTSGPASGATFPIGTTTVTYTATDPAGNTANCSFNVTVAGIVPVINCPSNIKVRATDGLCGAMVNYTATETTAIPASTITYSIAPGTFFAVGTRTVTATATNAVGTSSCTFMVTVIDDQFPVLTGVPANVTVECNAVPTPAIVTAGDNCSTSVPSFIEIKTNGNCSGNYTLTRTWSTTDVSNNTTTATQVITVQDTQKPILSTAPSNVTVECNAVPAAATLTATDNCSTPTVVYAETRTDGFSPNNYTLTRTWTATDACGNFCTKTQVITVRDRQAPVPMVAALPTLTGDCSVVATAPTALDNCAGTITGTTLNPTSYVAQGVYTITWSYNDGNGNTSTQTQRVVVKDMSAPIPTVAVIPTVTGQCSATVTARPTATDACSGVTAAGTTTDPLTYSTQGTYTIHWMYVDNLGNRSYQDQSVIVKDNMAPVPNIASLPVIEGQCSVNINMVTSIHCTDNCFCCRSVCHCRSNDCNCRQWADWLANILSYFFGISGDNNHGCDHDDDVDDVNNLKMEAPTATDNCKGSITGTTTDPLTYTTQGTYTIHWKFDDGNGNISIQNQTVTVADVEAPVPNASSLSTIYATCSVTVTTKPTAKDNCAGTVTGTTTDPLTYSTQGTFVIHWTYRDGHDNITTQNQTVIVKDNTVPVINEPNDITISCGTSTLPAATGNATATDNCGAPVITYTDLVNGNKITRTWRATDAAGNYATDTQIITITDNVKPVITDVADITVSCGTSTLPAATGIATATDNCSTPVITYSDANSTNKITRTWKATDAAGNYSTSVQTITIVDNTKPTITVPANTTISCSGSTSPSSTGGSATGTDACSSVTISYSNVTTGSVISRTWKASDASGNYSTGVQTITLTDNTKPVISDVPDITINCGSSTTPAGCNSVATATDNCSTPVVTYSDVITTNKITRTWQAKDAAGNIATSTQVITIVDNTKPVISDVSDLTVNCGGSTLPSATGTATATDACSTPFVNYTDVTSGNRITRTWKATDAAGNYSTSTQTITIGSAFTATVNSDPSGNTYTGGNDNNLYIGYGAQSTALTVCSLPSAGAPYTYAWSGSSTNKLNSTTSAAPLFTPTAFGYYTFSVTVTNKYGCTSIASISICVTDIRVAGTSGSGAKVYMCHKPSGYNKTAQTIQVLVSQVPSHLGSNACGSDGNDRLGSCDQSPCNTTVANAIVGITAKATAENGDAKIATSEEDLKVTVMPNPTTTFFTLKLESKFETPVSMRVMDARGRIVDAKSKIGANSTIQIGHNYSSGTYYAELIQGNTRKVVQMVKGRG